jgi:hypothetical protein
MTAIPQIHTLTAQAINRACEARRANESRDDDTLRMSSIGNPCDRALWYALHWAHPPKPVEARIVRIFDNGNDREGRIVQYLRDAGFTVIDRDPATGHQFRVVVAGGALVGHTDGIITGIPESPVARHLLEIKTMKASRWKEFRAKGIKVSDPGYWVQAQSYAAAMDLTRILFVCENQDTKEIHTERLHVDPVAAAGVEARAGRIAQATTAPQRLNEDPTWYQCKMCAAHAVCHGGEPSRRNCRTCVAVQYRDGKWYCQRHAKQLSFDDQQSGCSQHLYDPAFVAGDQIDADETANTITYRMPDGSTWVDLGWIHVSCVLCGAKGCTGKCTAKPKGGKG